METDALILALDTASPVVSVAVGRGGEALAGRRVELRRSSERLLALVDECLEEVGARLADVAGIVALRGPGSFTGLRVGLATVLGLHQASGIAATALPTLRVLACAARIARPQASGPVVAVVDALRAEWFAQAFDARAAPPAPGSPLAEPEIVVADGVADLCASHGDGDGDGDGGTVVGFAVDRLRDAPAWRRWPADGSPALVTPDGLAAAALRLAALEPPAWDAALLTRPLYLRAPAVTLPGRPG